MSQQGYALFRYPYARHCSLMAGSVHECRSLAELSGQQGFVMAPFAVADSQPILVIRQEHVPASFPSLDLAPLSPRPVTNPRTDYHADFYAFHSRLLSGQFQKIVLSRSIVLPRLSLTDPVSLFERACRQYPRMFIALVYTPQSGLWMAATPETLLAGEDDRWQTMALAGTMAWSEHVEWSDKNRQEQHYVATYIAQQLQPFATDIVEEGPYTARAGLLAHLRSDFRFRLADSMRMGDLLTALHPTPAVCGLPKLETYRFILHNERHQRSYYSGFMGPFGIDSRTHLFVTLRCMQLFQDAYRLYAGGGLLSDSQEEQEWLETEAKLDTMRLILD